MLGQNILGELVGAGYSVTVVQRSASDKKVPGSVRSVQVDLTDKEQPISAFKGQVAVVFKERHRRTIIH